MRKLIFILVIVIAITVSFNSAFAQQGIPIGAGDGDGATTPIGGMAVLAALGGGYAIKKLREDKRK